MTYDDRRKYTIGSTELATAITGINPLELCTDLFWKSFKPSEEIEKGKRFEDLIEETYSRIGNTPFSDNYFKSDISEIPIYSGKNPEIKQIAEIMESKNIEAELSTAYEQLKKFFTKKDNILYEAQKGRKRCLDQIKAHECRKPIPKKEWEIVHKMVDSLKNYPFTLSFFNENKEELTLTHTIEKWLAPQYIVPQFQTEFFWKHEDGAECRAKFDMIWTWKVNKLTYGLCFDFKKTADISIFKKFWRKKYIWQAKHYAEGFKKWCSENEIVPYLYENTENMKESIIWYLVTESTEPFITQAFALKLSDHAFLDNDYNDAIRQVWEWMQSGKPLKRYREQNFISLYGRKS